MLVKISHYTLITYRVTIASYPGSWWAERERAWYLLFTHARSYLLLNMFQTKVGGKRVIHIHVIGSVTYNILASILV